MSDPYLETHSHTLFRLAQRWLVKITRPHGSTGRWNPNDQKRVCAYLWWRDDRRCGLCALRMERRGAHIEHVVPKKFGLFDLQSGRRGLRAVAGREWESRLHHPDNLQIAHSYCNRSKGNTPVPSKWRHPELGPLPVAESTVGMELLWLPRRTGKDAHYEGLPGQQETLRKHSRRRRDRLFKTNPVIATPAQQSDEELLRNLKKWRLAVANAQGKPAYMVITDRTLKELVSSRPQRIEELEKVYGIGQAKLDSYGQEILERVAGKR